MSVFFFDGFDFSNGNDYGPGGRLWDQGSQGVNAGVGEWGGFCLQPGSSENLFVNQWPGTFKKFPINRAGAIVGCAALFSTFIADEGNIIHPFMYFGDDDGTGETVQCSLWIEQDFTISVRSGRGQAPLDTAIATSSFVPPLDLWFYLEVKLTVGNPGGIEIRVNGTIVCSVSGIQTQQSGNPTWNTFHLTGMGQFGPTWIVDDLYLIDQNDATGSTDFLGEVRVQTNFPDGDGYETDFSRTSGLTNSSNVDAVINYTDNGHYNYDGNVGAIDLYAITPFLITGTIFGVQENMSVRKDNTGSRNICPLLRTAAVNFQGPISICYSSFTYAGNIWEYNPETAAPWTITDLNEAEFGIQVTS